MFYLINLAVNKSESLGPSCAVLSENVLSDLSPDITTDLITKLAENEAVSGNNLRV